MGDLGHVGAPTPELQVRWAPVRPRANARVGAWVCVALDLVVLGSLGAASPEESIAPLLGGWLAAVVLTFAWCTACWRLDAGETGWAHAEPLPPGPRQPRPGPALGVRAGLRAGWRPAAVWVVGGAVVLGVTHGVEVAGAFLVSAVLVMPIALALGWLAWLFLVVPVIYLAAGLGRRRTDQPSLGVPMIGYAVLLLMVLPVSLSLFASGAATDRWDAIPALIGYGGEEPTAPVLLWTARAGFAVIVLVGVGLWWWLGREQRRIEDRGRGLGAR